MSFIKYYPSFISFLTILIALPIWLKGSVDLNFLFGYGVLNLLFYYLVIFTLSIKIGNLIKKEDLGKYVFRMSRMQPVGFKQLVKREREVLIERHSYIQEWNFVIKQCRFLMIIHPLLVVLVLFS